MKLLISIPAACLLAAPAPAQERPPIDPNERLDALAGEYTVEARMWASPEAEPMTASGTATWQRSHDGKQMHEHFTLRVMGKELAGDAWIAWRPAAKRYELTQIDGFSSTTFWLVGEWNDARNRIALHDLDETRAKGRPALRWEYRYEADGFVKEMLQSDGKGGWVLMSDYRYTSSGPRGPRTTEVPGVVSVPMAEGFQWPVVEVFINGDGPFQMVLDTGASTTVLNPDLVEELGLESAGTSRIGDPSDPLANEVDVLTLDEVMFGDARFTEIAAVGWRDKPLIPIGDIRGVLGLPTFANCLLTLDYPNKRVELREGTLPEPNGKTVLPLTVRGLPSFPITVAGKVFEAHLDAGNARSLVLPGAWEEKIPLVEGSLKKGRGMRASGPVEFTIAKLEGSVNIGQHTFDSPEIRFDFGLKEANVGHALMQDFAVTLDQRSGRVRFAPPGDAEARVRQDGAIDGTAAGRRKLGIALGLRSDGVAQVNQVFPDSEGEKAGLQVDDVILTVNGDEVTQAVMGAALSGSDPILLEVERDGKTVDVVLFE